MGRSYRKSAKQVWIYGVHSVAALIQARPAEVSEVVLSFPDKGPRPAIAEKAEKLGIPVRKESSRAIGELCGSHAHQGAAARAPMPDYADLDEVAELGPGFLVALDSITDPHNLGAIMRTAEVLGASGVIMQKDRSAGLTPAVHKVSAGAVEWLPACRVTNMARTLKQLKDKGFWIYGADPAADESVENARPSHKSVLVIGSEGGGIRPVVKKQIDFGLRIPIKGHTESLNASVASAIILYVLLGRRPGF